MTLQHLEELGHNLRRRGPRWNYLVEPLRELYAAAKAGKPSPGWSLEHAADIAGALQIGPRPLAYGRCSCGTSSRTVLHLPDRWVSKCDDCQARWVTMER